MIPLVGRMGDLSKIFKVDKRNLMVALYIDGFTPKRNRKQFSTQGIYMVVLNLDKEVYIHGFLYASYEYPSFKQPQIRVHDWTVILVGIVPGPDKPCDLNPFLQVCEVYL